MVLFKFLWYKTLRSKNASVLGAHIEAKDPQARVVRRRTIEKNDKSSKDLADTGLACLVAIARFHRLPVEPSQLSHHYGRPGEVFGESDILLAAKSISLKSKLVTTPISKISDAVLPAIAVLQDGSFIVLARIARDEISGDIPRFCYMTSESQLRKHLI